VSQTGSVASDLLPERVLGFLCTRRLGRSYQYFSVCPSTSDVVRDGAAGGAPEGLLVVADSQTAGRGRLGRTWHSPPGHNLYLSLLLRPRLPARQVAPLTLLAGAALAHTLAEAGTTPHLRWPNDLLLSFQGEMRKAAGILTEMATDGDSVRHIVLGVGLNVNGLDFPPELVERATSLQIATGQAFDRARLLVDFLAAFETRYDQFLARGPGQGLVEWSRYADLGQTCRIDGDGVEGVAIGIDDAGALLVRDGTGRIHRMFSGDIDS
jgi:BirA family transcriptional regulator, biotin operon repressor / biotin---[acetyl-CoA-carboxylase] ligase